jgi:hypothetical protein
MDPTVPGLVHKLPADASIGLSGPATEAWRL